MDYVCLFLNGVFKESWALRMASVEAQKEAIVSLCDLFNRNVDGNISACICDRVDWSVVQTMLRSDEAGNVTLIRVEPQDTNSIMESGK